MSFCPGQSEGNSFSAKELKCRFVARKNGVLGFDKERGKENYWGRGEKQEKAGRELVVGSKGKPAL